MATFKGGGSMHLAINCGLPAHYDIGISFKIIECHQSLQACKIFKAFSALLDESSYALELHLVLVY